MSVVKIWHNTRTVIFIAPSDPLSFFVDKMYTEQNAQIILQQQTFI